MPLVDLMLPCLTTSKQSLSEEKAKTPFRYIFINGVNKIGLERRQDIIHCFNFNKEFQFIFQMSWSMVI